MSSSRLLARSARSIIRPDVCVFCHARQLLPVNCSNTIRLPAKATQSNVFKRNYAQKLDVKRLRADVDKKGRYGWYALTKKQGVLLVERDKAEAIYNDFVAHKDKKEYGKLVKQFTTKYGVTLEDIAGLALVTYSIPDLSDPTKRAMLPPSQHKTVAGFLLEGCAENEDPLAIKHILTAVYLNTYTSAPGARDIALLFPKSSLPKYQKTLEKLASKNDPEALTLQGLFAEQANDRTKAKLLYEKALQVKWVFTYAPGARHPAQLPITAPWIALGQLLKSDKDPAVRAQAQHAFAQGATKADDPLAYFELAAFHDRSSVEWLKCISKAAASGHREAMVHLAEFYRDAASSDAAVLRADSSGKLRQALDWALGWRPGSVQELAVEWFEAAGGAGHKGALMQLADWYESTGEKGKARDVWQRIVVPGVGVEEWPQVVHRAKGRLSGIRTA
ncbi:hypothetical protein N0V95_010081 [Ascochyta clinopodiicola]|nr:hypothetical protein N0V95_010081 [Ascochyta clinopodiicola]